MACSTFVTSVVIPEAIMTIVNGVFNGCSLFISVVTSDAVITIGSDDVGKWCTVVDMADWRESWTPRTLSSPRSLREPSGEQPVRKMPCVLPHCSGDIHISVRASARALICLALLNWCTLSYCFLPTKWYYNETVQCGWFSSSERTWRYKLRHVRQ